MLYFEVVNVFHVAAWNKDALAALFMHPHMTLKVTFVFLHFPFDCVDS